MAHTPHSKTALGAPPLWWASSVLLLCLVSSKASALEANAARERGGGGLESATEGLLLDVRRIVTTTESSGWFLDQTAIDDAYPTLLQSVCRAHPSARVKARAHLDEAAARAGDPEELYSTYKMSAPTEEALHARRAKLLYELTLDSAEADCPFWVEPRLEFTGRQTDFGRWTLNLETGGLLQLRQTDGTWTYGGGGGGRILIGKNFYGPLSLLFGGEFGGGAMLTPNTEPSEFVLNYFPAVPVVLRLRDGNWHYELETAAVALFQANDFSFSYGGRIGAGIGLWALRTRSILPWAGIAVAYEHYVASGGRPMAHFLRGGVRVGFSFDGQ